MLYYVALALTWLSSVWLYKKLGEASLKKSDSMTFEVTSGLLAAKLT